MLRPRAKTLLFGILLALGCAGFVALGNWQLHRRVWKLDLIARVDARLRAAPVPAPDRAQWPAIDAAHDEYRRICASGTYLEGRDTLVQAVTKLGPGFWVMTPLRGSDGSLILIDRGFVDDAHRDAVTHRAPQAPLQVCGLLRLSEPRGAFLRHNDAKDDRWYSRDVAAIAAARSLPAGDVAPYFIDADAAATAGAWPVGGLTVVRFRNSHLSYALTWYALASICAAGLVLLIRQERLRRVQSSSAV